jgi:recombination protein RecR
VCGNLDNAPVCCICSDEKRDQTTLCIVEEVADLWAMERSKSFRGLYHVLGGTLSALEGRGPDQLNMQNLISRLEQQPLTEIILATNATIDGQTTAYYITERLKPYPNVKISRIAQGIPMGGELDYLDDGTLGAALMARTPF